VVSLSLVTVNEDEFGRVSGSELDQLQREQFEHDENCHREIARLPVQNRLAHMTLHFAKYAGRLAEGQDDGDFQRTATDILVIALSSANILNLLLSQTDVMSPGDDSTSRSELARVVTISAGKMAAACEKLDHLEDFPFRPTISAGVVEIARVAIALCKSEGWNVGGLVRQRLEGIRAKALFPTNIR
jgi:hypothetical protein